MKFFALELQEITMPSTGRMTPSPSAAASSIHALSVGEQSLAVLMSGLEIAEVNPEDWRRSLEVGTSFQKSSTDGLISPSSSAAVIPKQVELPAIYTFTLLFLKEAAKLLFSVKASAKEIVKRNKMKYFMLFPIVSEEERIGQLTTLFLKE